MSKIFLTSDTHFGHDRQFLFGPRGFENIADHDAAVIANWNAVVGPDDIVYHLGDVMLNDNAHGLECLRQLNGHIKIIRGNHDTDARWALYGELPNVELLGWAEVIKYKKYRIYLSHHFTNTSNLEGSGYLREHLLNFFGHTHQKGHFFEDRPYTFHVGLDSNNNTPVLIDDALEIMKAEVRKCIDMLGENAAEIAEPAAMSVLAPATDPVAAVTYHSTFAVCDKCVNIYPLCGHYPTTSGCIGFRRDPPDGGFYG